MEKWSIIKVKFALKAYKKTSQVVPLAASPYRVSIGLPDQRHHSNHTLTSDKIAPVTQPCPKSAPHLPGFRQRIAPETLRDQVCSPLL